MPVISKMWSGGYLQTLAPKVWQIFVITTCQHSQDKAAALLLCSKAGREVRPEQYLFSFSCAGMMCFPTHPSRKEIPLFFLSNECCLSRHLWTAFSEGWLMVRIHYSLPYLNGSWHCPCPYCQRQQPNIFCSQSMKSTWAFVYTKIWPIIFMDSLQAAQRSVHFLAYGYSYSSNLLYKATTERKMTETHFTGYVLLVPGPVCLTLGVWWAFRDSSSPAAPQPLLQALAQIQHHLPALAFIPEAHWDEQVRLLTHPCTSSLVSPGFSLEQCGLSFFLPS